MRRAHRLCVAARVLARVNGDETSRAGGLRDHQAEKTDAARPDDHHVVAHVDLALEHHALPRAGKRFRERGRVE